MKKTHSLSEHEKEIEAGKRGGVLSFLRIGRALSAIQAGDLWQPIAPSFSIYVENVHGIKRSWAYSLVKIWQTFGQPLLDTAEFQQIEVTRLVQLLPLTTEENKMELLHEAAQVPDVRGWENQLRNRKNLVATDDPHDCDFQSVNWEYCIICGKRRRRS